MTPGTPADAVRLELVELERLDRERTDALAEVDRLTAGMSQVAAFRAANAAAVMGHSSLSLARRLVAVLEELDDQRNAYEVVRDSVIDELNPPDDDVGEEAILTAAIEGAARVLERTSCTCSADVGPPEGDALPCPRCSALGRARDVRIDR